MDSGHILQLVKNEVIDLHVLDSTIVVVLHIA